VADTGAGIPADRVDRLFKRFSQVDASTTRLHGGTGLGLALGQGLAEAMGGEIGAISLPGQGSCFWFEIPCALAPPPAATGSLPLVGPAEPDALQGLRLLVADDNAINRQLVRIIVSQFGVVLTEAADGHEAVRIARSTAFDLILMDLRMPELDGTAAAEAIRAEGPNTHIPIIAFTAEAHGSGLPASLKDLFDDQLPKPIVAADLVSMIAAWGGAVVSESLGGATQTSGTEHQADQFAPPAMARSALSAERPYQICTRSAGAR
jgi:CheY-like chemotaxis protein